MSDDQSKPTGPDLAQGIDAGRLRDGAMLVGRLGDQAVLLARSGNEIFAVGATCTHYGGPLGEGLLVGDTVRCPWHHACFSLRTGEAIRAPALNDIPCFTVETRDGKLFVRQARKSAAQKTSPPAAPSSVVIVGGGAAAEGALETLRREGYGGPITVLSADADPPCDRPNLSKDYLAGTASEDWIPLRDAAFYQQHAIDLRMGTRVVAIDARQRIVRTQDGSAVPYGDTQN
jgi:nitrite reductase/ring-hydroxylating ferredoxin subunit